MGLVTALVRQPIWVIQWSLQKLGNAVRFFAGQTTDNGGGGVLENLMKWLMHFGLVDPASYKFAPCTLHALQLSFATGVKEVYGEGGLSMRNVMQLIHSCYDLQSCLGWDERILFWETASEATAPNAMSAAVLTRWWYVMLTRWWYVNTAALHLKEHFEEWMAFRKKKTRLLARLSLGAEPKICCDLLFICAYSKAFFVEHFKWLQD